MLMKAILYKEWDYPGKNQNETSVTQVILVPESSVSYTLNTLKGMGAFDIEVSDKSFEMKKV